MKKISKAAFIRSLCDGSAWEYVSFGNVNPVLMAENEGDILGRVAAWLDDNMERVQMEPIDHRTYRHTSGNRAVANTGSVLDLGKKDHVFQYGDDCFVCHNDYYIWGYIRN